jgi:hypothetical protein
MTRLLAFEPQRRSGAAISSQMRGERPSPVDARDAVVTIELRARGNYE